MKLGPGVNLELSWKRAFGLTKARQRFARATGIPTTRRGVQQKVGRGVLRSLGLHKDRR